MVAIGMNGSEREEKGLCFCGAGCNLVVWSSRWQSPDGRSVLKNNR